MATIRVGIIGCGRIAASHVRCYKAHGATVTAVADVNPTAAEALASDVGCATCFDSAEALLASGKVDAVSVCTPPALHEGAVVAALERGIAVLCEKPFATTLEAGRRMAAIAESSGSLLMLAHPNRFRPASLRMREIVDSGQLGPLVFYHNSFCGNVFWVKDTWYTRKAVAGAGVLLDIGAHCVDLFRFLVGEVVEAHAVSHRHLEGTDVEDAGIIALKADNGAIGTVSMGWVVGSGQAYVSILGQRGRLYYEYGAEILFLGSDGQRETFPVEVSDGFVEEVGHFLAVVRGEAALRSTACDGLRALEVILPFCE